MAEPVLIIGASGRAAAFSALRAGLTPYVIDLFADEDLRAVAEVRRSPSRQYPHGLVALAGQFPPMPFMYTGGLENYPDVIAAIAAERPLWGNGPEVLAKVRDPFALAAMLHKAGLPHPQVRCWDDRPNGARWLSKPLRGAGGAGIRFAPAQSTDSARYFQEFIEGESRSAVFRDSDLLGVTRQLVGNSWLHAPQFGYCGSFGPLAIADSEREAWLRLAQVLIDGSGSRWLFGIDAILRDGVPWLIEVNPRYTASMEVIERALAISCFAGGRAKGESAAGACRNDKTVAKAIYYAPHSLVFPAAGPWRDRPTGFADIPLAGTRIHRGRPVLTIFGRDEAELRRKAAELDTLFGGECKHDVKRTSARRRG